MDYETFSFFSYTDFVSKQIIVMTDREVTE